MNKLQYFNLAGNFRFKLSRLKFLGLAFKFMKALSGFHLYQKDRHTYTIQRDNLKLLSAGINANKSLTSIGFEFPYGNKKILFLLNRLKANRKIKHLDLSSCGITYNSMNALERFLRRAQHITTINLENNFRVGDKEITGLLNALKNNNTITKMILNNIRASSFGILEVARFLEKNKTITHLELNRNFIDYYSINAIAIALKYNHTLTNMYLIDMKGFDGVYEKIAQSLKINKTLTHFYIGNNSLYSDNLGLKIFGIYDYYNKHTQTIKVFTETLKVNQNMTLIHLQDLKINDEQATILAEALENNDILTQIGLEGNEIGDVGALAFAQVLKKNKTLTLVNLHRNFIGENGAKDLAQALAHNQTLKVLYLGENRFNAEGVHALINVSKQNKTLSKLEFTYRQSNAEVMKILVHSLKMGQIKMKLFFYCNSAARIDLEKILTQNNLSFSFEDSTMIVFPPRTASVIKLDNQLPHPKIQPLLNRFFISRKKECKNKYINKLKPQYN